jgi:hypothetical protein
MLWIAINSTVVLKFTVFTYWRNLTLIEDLVCYYFMLINDR